MYVLCHAACTSFRTIQVYVTYAGTEHEDFIQHFPYWVVDKQVQQLNCKVNKWCVLFIIATVTVEDVISGIFLLLISFVLSHRTQSHCPRRFTLMTNWRNTQSNYTITCMLPWLLCRNTRMCYTLEELRQRPLPNEVDPTKMETYLTEHDFQVGALSLTPCHYSYCLTALLFLLYSWRSRRRERNITSCLYGNRLL